jgi:hypothetical protein
MRTFTPYARLNDAFKLAQPLPRLGARLATRENQSEPTAPEAPKCSGAFSEPVYALAAAAAGHSPVEQGSLAA